MNDATIDIYYQNVNGLRTKTTSFLIGVISSSFKIYILCETNLNDSINDLEIFPPEFTIYRCNRSHLTSKKTQGGGVLIAVHRSMYSELIVMGDEYGVEQCWIKIRLKNKWMFLGGLYIPPKSPYELYHQHLNLIESTLSKMNHDDIAVLCGDFNLPAIKWIVNDEDETNLLPTNISNDEIYEIINEFNCFDLKQINSVINDNKRILDLIFVNDSNMISSELCKFNLIRNEKHHKALEIHVTTNIEDLNPDEQMNYYNFAVGNYNVISQKIRSINWYDLLQHIGVDDATNVFYSKINEIITDEIPMIIKKPSKAPIWTSKNSSKLKNRMKNAHIKFKNSQNDDDYRTYSEIRKEYKKQMLADYKNYVHDIELEIKSNPKKFFKFINSKKKSGNVNNIPLQMSYINSTATNLNEICDLFADFFQSVYEPETICDESQFEYLKSSKYASIISLMPDISIGEDEIKSYLKGLSDNTNPGPDGIPEFFIKKCFDAISEPILLLFNKSLNSGIVPEIWKKSFICPIFKSGSRNNIENYRGVSNQSSIPKVLDAIVTNYLDFHISSVIGQFQHGFTRGKSTSTNLTEFSSIVITSNELHQQTDTIFTDFSKAFDKVPISILLLKMLIIGVNNKFMKWLTSSLSGRVQFVKIGNIISKAIQVTSGVGQGTHIGAKLFLLFINDIDLFISIAKILLYADDLKLFMIISNLIDCLLLQRDLISFSQWCKLNQLKVNIKKCKTMTFSRSEHILKFSYSIDDEMLQRVTSFVDLGVTLDKKMSFNTHIEKITSKAMRMLGFIFRNAKEFNDPYVLKTLFCTYVRPILEYASIVWSPNYAVHNKKIEMVQKKFLRFCLRKLGWNDINMLPPYSSRLMLIDMNTLEHRRIVAAIMFIFKLIKGTTSSGEILNRIDFNTTNANLRNRSLIYTKFHRTNYGKNEPINYMCELFNKYFNFIDFNLTQDALKTSLLKYFENLR